MQVLASSGKASRSAERAAFGREMVSRLGNADLAPPGLPPTAVLVVRSLSGAGALRLRSGSLRLDTAWERGVRSRLAEALGRAARPVDARLPPGAEAVLFVDEAEMWACLAVDLLAGSAGSRWWWRALLRGGLPTLPRLFVREARYVPAIFDQLDAWRRLDDVVAVLRRAEVSAVLEALVHEHALAPELAAVELRQAELLVGLALGLRRAPHEVRSATFARRVLAWSAGRGRPFGTKSRRDVGAPSERPFGTKSRQDAGAPSGRPFGTKSRQDAGVPTRSAAIPQRDERATSRSARPPAGGKGRPGSPRTKPEAMDGLPAAWVEAPSALAGGARPSHHHGARADTSPSDPPDVARPRAVAVPGPSYAPRADRAPGTDRDMPSVASGFVRGLPGLPLPPSLSLERLPTPEAPLGAPASRRLFVPEGRPHPAGDFSPRPGPDVGQAAPAAPPRTTENPEPTKQTSEEPTPPSRPHARPPDVEAGDLVHEGVSTRLGGVLYLVNAALAADLFAALEYGGELDGQLGAWALLELLGRALLPDVDPADPIWPVLAELDGRPPTEPPPRADGFLASVAPAIRRRLGEALADPSDEALAALVACPGQLYVTATHVDLVASLDAISLAARRAGLDRDPGWVPALGRIVTVHFEETFHFEEPY